ncbi:MAG: FAD-dependent oxidoreductase [Oscillospiraceae bacterium]|jgi:NADPH-dependent 2,4-dienoyl-CoA reductase/sulfur reductase-like enzyme|nr:FAD-dependent oxidoreductase [Oscillospiraceae bacterium]
MKKILIVGGVAGGASAAARLRRLDETAGIILFERGGYISFANCGLPYYIGGKIKSKAALTLQTPESFHARYNVDVRIFSEVTAVDRQAKTVTVKNLRTGESYTESYGALILSPGAEPVRPPVPGMDSGRVFTLRNIPDTTKITDFIRGNGPKTAVVCGGGYIGVEMAENLVRAGLSVTVVELAGQVIAPLDYDMACDVHRYMERKGVALLLGNAAKEITDNGNGLTVTLSDGVVRADMLIMAVGVRPESALAKAAGLAVGERGGIVVNGRMQTSDEAIYAVGDAAEVTDFVTGQKAQIPLAGPANKQGRIAADNICGIPSVYEGTQGSAILKVFDMTVATTGINEKTAERLGLNYDKSFTYSEGHAGYYPGAAGMSVKIIFEKTTGKILGAQIVGFGGVDKRCDVLAVAIRAGMTAGGLARLELCYAPPYSSAKDPVNMAGFAAENLLTGKVKNFHWHDVKELPRDGSVTLIDTRAAAEYKKGHIGGFVNIPLDKLRERLGELDRGKTVYVTCQVGLRGYLAARILSQNGFDVYNLSGGYRLYDSVCGVKGEGGGSSCDI